MTRVAPGWKRPYLTGFGARLQALREQHGWSREELGRRAAISRGQVRKLETGIHPPRSSTLDRLATALGVDRAELAAVDGSARPTPMHPDAGDETTSPDLHHTRRGEPGGEPAE